ncbi:MAG: LOG family protein [Kangiellaceae bacterium]|jgi:uncharacterized protein (TIGR00730 family)|nr:LOG family protein [Kangiellaceae bacterium]
MADKLENTFQGYSTLAKSKEMVEQSKQVEDSPQTASPSYQLAFDDPDFMLQDEQRDIRLMLEWQKPERILNDHNIEATWVVFGSARIGSSQQINDKIAIVNAKIKTLQETDTEYQELTKQKAILQKLEEKSFYYDLCTELTKRLANPVNTGIHATVITGGGPGIMEAANKGAALANWPSIGLNIVLPTEQEPNHYISPEFCFQFHYFAIRKMHFLMRAKALIAFPGGLGTLDEVMETLTLLQTGRIKQKFPVILFGESYWRKIVNFDALVEEGVISENDLGLFCFVDTVDDALAYIINYYREHEF